MIARSFGALSVAEWPGPLPTVIALHGRAGHAREWDWLADSLVTRHLVAPDLRGHGESSWADDYRLASMVGDVISCIDATASGPVDVVGHSLGGLVAMVLAAEHPEMVRRLVIADIGPELRHLDSTADGSPSVTFDSQEAAIANLRDRHPIAPVEVLTGRVMHGVVPDPAGGWRWRHDPAVDDVSTDPVLRLLWEHWEAVEAPTLVIRGGESIVLSEELAGQMKHRARATVDLACIGDAGHNVHADRPEEFGELVLRWITARGSPLSSKRS